MSPPCVADTPMLAHDAGHSQTETRSSAASSGEASSAPKLRRQSHTLTRAAGGRGVGSGDPQKRNPFAPSWPIYEPATRNCCRSKILRRAKLTGNTGGKDRALCSDPGAASDHGPPARPLEGLWSRRRLLSRWGAQAGAFFASRSKYSRWVEVTIVFSSDAGRNLLEQELLRADVCSICPNLNVPAPATEHGAGDAGFRRADRHVPQLATQCS